MFSKLQISKLNNNAFDRSDTSTFKLFVFMCDGAKLLLLTILKFLADTFFEKCKCNWRFRFCTIQKQLYFYCFCTSTYSVLYLI